MGAVDLVVQVESPPSVASGLQRIGRAGHQVGAISHGVMFPKHRGDLVPAAVTRDRMSGGQIEAIRPPRNPLDVLAQHIVAMLAMEPWTVEELAAVVRRAAPFAALPDSALHATLDMLAGRYPSDEFAELRPRIVWDRVTGTLTGRPGAQRLAVTSGGTIPDRGLFGVFLIGERQSRVGELDEEMVYESRVGEVFTLGSTSWRIEEITHDRVLVSPAPGQPGKMPFWHGDALGRPVELGRALGAFVRDLQRLDDDRRAGPAARRSGWTSGPRPTRCPTSPSSAPRPVTSPTTARWSSSGSATSSATGGSPIHSPFGAQVHAPWGLALQARMRERSGMDVQVMHTDDGIVLRLPDTDDAPPPDLTVFDPEEIEAIVTQRARRLGAVRLALPRVRRPRAAAAEAQPRPARAAVAATPTIRPAAQRRRPVRLVPDRPRDDARVPAGRLRRPRPRRADARHRQPQRCGSSRSRPSSPRRTPAVWSSATSARSCTKATSHSPSGGPRRSRSTRRCSPSCSATSSSASCSTPTPSPRSRPSSPGCTPERRLRSTRGRRRRAARPR